MLNAHVACVPPPLCDPCAIDHHHTSANQLPLGPVGPARSTCKVHVYRAGPLVASSTNASSTSVAPLPQSPACLLQSLLDSQRWVRHLCAHFLRNTLYICTVPSSWSKMKPPGCRTSCVPRPAFLRPLLVRCPPASQPPLLTVCAPSLSTEPCNKGSSVLVTGLPLQSFVCPYPGFGPRSQSRARLAFRRTEHRGP